MANMTDVSTNEPKVFARCQQEFINRHVCICSRLSIHPSLSAHLCITVAVCCHSVDWLWAGLAAGASICNPSTLGKRFRIMAASFCDIMLKSHLALLFCLEEINIFLFSSPLHIFSTFYASIEGVLSQVFVITVNIINGCEVARPHLHYSPMETVSLYWVFW